MRLRANAWVAAAFWLTIAPPASAESPSNRVTDEELAVYSAFLKPWLGTGSALTNLSDQSVAITDWPARDKAKCLLGIELMPVAPERSAVTLRGTNIEKMLRVRLVDEKRWRPRDPGDAIRRGESVGDAVQKGFNAGLLSLSAIAFDATHETAVFEYSYGCGSLCGSGAMVVFRKVGANWVERQQPSCGGWIS